jgi:hypothetical protein
MHCLLFLLLLLLQAVGEVRKLFVNCCRVRPDRCLELLGAILNGQPQPFSKGRKMQSKAIRSRRCLVLLCCVVPLVCSFVCFFVLRYLQLPTFSTLRCQSSKLQWLFQRSNCG